MRSWVAAFWGPEDLPVLRLIGCLFDHVAAGTGGASARGELRLLMDNYGITPKGQTDRRWSPPKEAEHPTSGATIADPYAHLFIVQSKAGR